MKRLALWVWVWVGAGVLLFLLTPWLMTAADAYLDWEWCATHDQGPQVVNGMEQFDWYLWQERCS